MSIRQVFRLGLESGPGFGHKVGMCANYTPPTDSQIVEKFKAKYLGDQHFAGGDPFPSHAAPIVFETTERFYDRYLWGLLPRGARNTEFWKDYATFNAKSETITKSKLFSKPWQEGRRCVIPVLSFVEWQGQSGRKKKLHIGSPDIEILPIAGIWDHTGTEEKPGFQTFTMLTTAPNEFMKKLHHRMPVILDDWEAWLDPDLPPEDAESRLKPYAGELQIISP